MIFNLILLLIAHGIGDLPLQPGWLSRAKRSHWWGLPLHGAIHGALAGLVLLNWQIAIAELVAHTAIDFLKVRKLIDTETDQLLHVVWKVVWVVWLA